MKLASCLLAIGVVTFLGCGKKSAFPPSNEWIRFQSPDAPYSVLMPGKPVRAEQAGGIITHTCELDHDQGVVTSGIQLPPEFNVSDKKMVSERLDLAVSAVAAGFAGEILNKKNLIIDKIYPARDCTIKANNEGQTMIIRIRLIITPDNLIQHFVVAQESESTNPLIQKCLDSIKVKQEVD